ncbi:hypothetical protein [Paraburkholderia phenazinium]|jgi:hypothetical protein|uniref:Uncharacterized protein n=1 Tax=Paraburkholderia phenazinium TaxID=60549 RepID=A0A1G7RYJ2_9BURK|nr:hypothetical protein [Paraburkholderia phenazinium]SDG15838.1 hypothetical protein SAMN05216466_102314 [Paraburkholderia phenazinium]
MSAAEKSLHWIVDKWLAPTPATPARITRMGRTGSRRGRAVCVETLRPGGLLSIVFFRHDDGSWNVFPPAAERPAMNGYRRAAGTCAFTTCAG